MAKNLGVRTGKRKPVWCLSAETGCGEVGLGGLRHTKRNVGLGSRGLAADLATTCVDQERVAEQP